MVGGSACISSCIITWRIFRAFNIAPCCALQGSARCFEQFFLLVVLVIAHGQHALPVRAWSNFHVKFPHLAACWLSDRLPSAEMTDGVRTPWCENAFMPASEGQAAVKAVAESTLALQHLQPPHFWQIWYFPPRPYRRGRPNASNHAPRHLSVRNPHEAHECIVCRQVK